MQRPTYRSTIKDCRTAQNTYTGPGSGDALFCFVRHPFNISPWPWPGIRASRVGGRRSRYSVWWFVVWGFLFAFLFVLELTDRLCWAGWEVSAS